MIIYTRAVYIGIIKYKRLKDIELIMARSYNFSISGEFIQKYYVGSNE